jgi:hypothetical protein
MQEGAGATVEDAALLLGESSEGAHARKERLEIVESAFGDVAHPDTL